MNGNQCTANNGTTHEAQSKDRVYMYMCTYVTVHDKTDHIALKLILALRVPWPSMMFGLPMVQVRGSTILNIAEKRNRSYYIQYTGRVRIPAIYVISIKMKLAHRVHVSKPNGYSKWLAMAT